MEAELVIKMIFGIVGGLGIFLLGMKNMSEGMQAVAGAKLRKLINAVTNNRIIACGVGTVVTSLIQSSSVTTVMVVGMVNAGLMSLVQAIGVILGANIGTTITAWILVLKVGKYGLPLLGISAFFFLFSKRDRVRYTAGMFLGLGMVFFGLELMKDGFGPLKEMPQFIEWFSRFTPDTYLGVIRCCLVGAILTEIVQSSSATIGITIGLAWQNIIDFPTAAALVLGENIGTCITAILASWGASTNAKRAALAHIFINVIGVLWITAIFQFYIKVIQWLVGSNTTAAIAATHTVFNVANTLIFMPFVGLLSQLLYKILPDKPYKEEPRLTFLDVRMLDTPAIGIQQSQREILKMSRAVKKMLDQLKGIIAEQKPNDKKKQEIFDQENNLDVVQKEIVEFLGNIMAGNISHEVMGQGRKQLRMADELESISDYITNILKLNLKMRDTNQRMSQDGHDDILDLHDRVADYIQLIDAAVQSENSEILSEAQVKGQAITHIMKEYRSRHLSRVGTGPTTPLKSLIYTDMLNAYRRIKDYALNIAEVLAGEK